MKRTYSSLPLVLALCTLVTLISPSKLMAQESPTPKYIVEPNTLQIGDTYDVYIKTDPVSTFDPTKVKVTPSNGSGINCGNGNPQGADNNHVLTIKCDVTSGSQPGTTKLQIKEEGKMLGLVDLTIISFRPVAQQPVPKNIDEPIVSWKVLDNHETRAAFGHYVSKNYYCIEATITNKSGYDYQVENIEFKLPDTSINTRVPATTLGMARATLERGHLIGWRNESLSAIKAFGPILTGFTPFFKVQNHQLLFSKSINIFSDPFEKGFEAVIPDTTIPELQRLNDQILSEGFIIRNSSRPITKYVLFPKGFFGSSGKKDNPIDIMKELGEAHLSASPIIFLNSREINSTLSTSTNSSR